MKAITARPGNSVGIFLMGEKYPVNISKHYGSGQDGTGSWQAPLPLSCWEGKRTATS